MKLAERVAAARTRAGLAQADLAAVLNRDRSTITKVEAGRRGLLVGGLAKIAETLSVSTDYLLGLTDDPTPAADLAEGLAALADPEQALDVDHVGTNTVRAAAGSGAMVFDETQTGRLAFQRSWLRRHGIDHKRACVITVAGHSMEPTLPDGCSVLVDYQRREPRDGRIYVLRRPLDGVVVKRLEGDGDAWLAVSDNRDRPEPRNPITRAEYALLSYRVLRSRIEDSLDLRNAGRPAELRVEFRQMFHMTHADGANMLTVGGAFIPEANSEPWETSGIDSLEYTRSGDEPLEIKIPSLTRREMRHLLTAMPGASSDVQRAAAEAGIPLQDAKEFAAVYRYSPLFVEAEDW